MKYVLALIAAASLLIFFYFTTSTPTSPNVSTLSPQPETTSNINTHDNFINNNFDTLKRKNKEQSLSSQIPPVTTNVSSSSSTTRGIIALYLTHVGFHGVGLVKANIHGWVQNLMLPQKNLDLILFYDTSNVSEEILVSKIGLTLVPNIGEKIENFKNSNNHHQEGGNSILHTAMMNHNIIRPLIMMKSPSASSSSSSATPLPSPKELSEKQKWFTFCSPYNSKKNCVLLSLVGVEKKWPKYLQDSEKRNDLLSRKDWLRCGCPPYCPVRRNPPEYVQGTRWYTYDIFFDANGWIRKYYDYWVKLDVDIGIFRPLPAGVNLLEEMKSKNKIFLHTGYTYNGGGCSRNLHNSILNWCKTNNIQPVSENEKWWKQDDNVYYSNFVISSVKFHTSEKPLDLARFLNDEVEEGFFKYRWTDQSLFHKVFGVFVGPKEEDFLLDYSWMRWTKKVYRKNAVFYHSKKGKSRGELGKYTSL